jgi:uncharacterized protein YjbJ (UPF0337 family)
MSSGSPGYALEKLSTAVHSLAVGKGDVRNRLRGAFMSFHPVQESDFPEHLKAKWRWIKGELTKFGPIVDDDGKVVDGSVDHTLSRIKNSTGRRIAEAIVSLQSELDSYLRHER